MTNKILDKLKKNSTIKRTSTLSTSGLLGEDDFIPTKIPALNIILSGRLDGGLSSGITVWAGESRRFKTSFALMMAKTYMDKYYDAAMLFYDSEFGSPLSFFDSFGIDKERVIYTPIATIEDLKIDLTTQLENIERGDKVIVVVDSIGRLASKKATEDRLDAKPAADIKRSKSLRSLFRVVAPKVNFKGIPLVAINHIYKSISGLVPTDVAAGGTGSMYLADNVFIIGRRQDGRDSEIKGHHFMLKVEKSRFVQEKKEVPILVNCKKDISAYSGLLDIALDSGHVVSPSKGWYQKKGGGEKLRAADTQKKDFWLPILTDLTFKQYVIDTYSITSINTMEDGSIDEIVADNELDGRAI